MWRLIVGAVAVGVIAMADVVVAAGFWLPPDFGTNSPDVAVAVGDSITLGTLADDAGTAAQPYPAVLQSLLAPAHPGFVVVNTGVGGETTSEGLDRLAGTLVANHPGFVLIMEGTNDATHHESAADIVANLRAMIQLAKANFSIPILGTIIPNHRSYAPEARAIIAQVNAMLPALAAQEGIRLVNTFGPMNDGGLFGSDDLHPTPHGYQVLGAAWRPAVHAAIIESKPLVGGVAVAAGNIVGSDAAEFVTGAGSGGSPLVRVFRANGVPLGGGFLAYAPLFRGGVRVAVCDFTGDGVDEIVTAPGPGGGPHVRVFKVGPAGQIVADLANFFPYPVGFTGGVFVACGDLDDPPDGIPEIVVGAGRGGGPHVRVLRYAPGHPSTGNVVDAGVSFFAYSAQFKGGVHVAVGNVDGDPTGQKQIITGAGAGGGPHVRVFRFAPGNPGGVVETGKSFMAYNAGFVGGVHVAAGDLDGDGQDELITGPGRSGGPHVRILRRNGSGVATPVDDFFAYNPAFTGGVFVGAGDLDGDGDAEVVTGAGPGGGPHVRGFTIQGLPTGPGFLAY